VENVELCSIKSCKQPATKGVSTRFCDVHYEEFRNHMKSNEDTEERKTLQNQVALLKRQLAAAGQQPVEFVELHVARQKMQEAVQRLMSGDESAEKEIERWDAAIRMNPDYQKEQEEKAKKWDEDQRPKNLECLRMMRSLVPPDITQCNLESLSSRMPKTLAQRLWTKKALWLVRMHEDDIKRIHIADLRSKYGNQGLDVVEMRAIWVCLPNEFDNDGDGKKAEWLGFFRQKLEELTNKEAANRLSKMEQRNPAYKGCENLSVSYTLCTVVFARHRGSSWDLIVPSMCRRISSTIRTRRSCAWPHSKALHLHQPSSRLSKASQSPSKTVKRTW
jgi:hypothetical protein